jgi:hypothetical protein
MERENKRKNKCSRNKDATTEYRNQRSQATTLNERL